MKEELKIKDVMVGDWIDVRNDAAPNTSHLERITPSHFLRDEHWYGVELVPEILEKNGFVCKGAWCLEGEDMGLKQIGNSWALLPYYYDYDGFRFTIISYVHELQHALRLCGIEKEIVL